MLDDLETISYNTIYSYNHAKNTNINYYTRKNCFDELTLKSFWLSIIFLTLSPISFLAYSTTSCALLSLSDFRGSMEDPPALPG
jgi:hypothetical protein